MELILALFLALLILVLTCYIPRRRNKLKRNQPPSPPSLPILGHLHLLKKPLHRSLAAISASHGPILSLRYGSRPVLLVSSLPAATECFTKNDIAFANRPRLTAGKLLGYNFTTIAWAPYGHLWRNLRRITTLEIFSTTRLNSFSGVRSEEVVSLVKSLARDSELGSKTVVLKTRLFELSLNIMMRMLAGKRYYGDEVADAEEAEKFREVIEETFLVSGNNNLCDFLPFLKVLGYGGVEKLVQLRKKRDQFLQALLDKHREKHVDANDAVGGEVRTVVDVLLSLQKTDPEYYTDEIVKGVIVTMLTAGTDTSSVTVEWAMSRLLNHPHVLKKARLELREQVGPNRLVQDSDLSKLPFLQAIIQETLRLHPPAPVIPAHESWEPCKVGGFDLPAGTILLVNAWAIHRDPGLWVEPDEFRPERWMSEEPTEIEAKTLPFGLGRRACPGEGLALRVVGLTLATLIQCFEWRREGEELVDLSEGSGLTMPKRQPLVAWCHLRPLAENIISV